MTARRTDPGLLTALSRQVALLADLEGEVDPEAHLYHELGVSSVQAMELLLGLEERHGLSIPDEEFVDATTLNDLAALLARLLGEGVA